MLGLVHLHLWKHWNLWMEDILHGYKGWGNMLGQILPVMEAEREQTGLGTLRGSLWHIMFQTNLQRKLPTFSTLSVLTTCISYYSSNYFNISLLKSQLCVKGSLEGLACEFFPLLHFYFFSLLRLLHQWHSAPKHDSLSCWADWDPNGVISSILDSCSQVPVRD